MKKLELKQMENVQGGLDYETGHGLMCAVGIFGTAVSGGLAGPFALSLCLHGFLAYV